MLYQVSCKYHVGIFGEASTVLAACNHYFSDISRRVYVIEMQMLEREGYSSSLARKQNRPVFLLPSLSSTEGDSSCELYTSLCPVETRKEMKAVWGSG